MNIKNLTWLGFFLTLSTVTIVPKTLAINPQINTVENRLNRISESLKTRLENLGEEITPEEEKLLSQFLNGGRGWGNGRWRNGGGWIDTNRGSFVNNRGPGGFINSNRGGGFYNYPRGWRDGGSFWNRW